MIQRKLRIADIMKFVMLLMAATTLASCNVHEWPHCDETRTYTLNLEFDTAFSQMDFEYTRAQDETYDMTYTVRAFPIIDGNVKRDPYAETAFTREVTDNYDCTTTLDLEPGKYRIMVWADFREADGNYYYNSDNFADIKLTGQYVGSTDTRDAFAGILDIVVPEQGEEIEGESLTSTVAMDRPLGKYQFVSTGLKEFVEKEAQSTMQEEIRLEDYYVVFAYPQFMPSAYNMFSERPSDSQTGVRFFSELTEYGEGEASLGFDYVFVNHSESFITVQASVFRKADDRLVARTPAIRIPLQRNYNTIVRGSFLLTQSNDGVSINPGYDGEFNIHAPLQ